MPGIPSVEQIRSHFPALGRELNGRPFAYFDGPGGTQVPRAVAEAVSDYLLRRNANTHGAFATSQETDAILAAARAAVADFLGAGPREVVFGQNMTTLTFQLSRSLAQSWRPGDEIVVTQLDHQANVAPWRLAAAERGVTVRTLPFHPESCTLAYEQMAELIGPRTRLVAVGAASNAVGTINEVRRLADAAHAAGALCFVDAVHYAPHRLVDVAALGADFLACSAYKFFGPHLGILWGREALLAELQPYKVPPASDAAPERWETGTLNHEGIAGTRAAVDWIAGLAGWAGGGGRRDALRAAMEGLRHHEDALFERVLAGLRSSRGVRVYGVAPGAPRTPTVGFTVAGRTPGEVARALAEEALCVWDGDFYASTVIERLGLAESGGLVRVGLAPYNDAGEVERLLQAVEGL